MAYNQQLAEKIRQALNNCKGVVEKKMFGGMCFMVHGKMCMGVVKDDAMFRLDPKIYDEALKKEGCRPMDFTGRPMKGFVFVGDKAISTKKDLDYWVQLALDFNKKAKPSKKKR
ncbi:MAG: hypothetical protein K940chlam8_00797 [Chlamydiae bacterium]|nr:hypothetical protein [Chlamydiota bacterium]